MSIEIAILNKIGIAVATDSNESWNVSNLNKSISIERIFPLSQYHPIAIIIEKSMFFFTPWEAIIKLYKDFIGSKVFNTLQEYADAFINLVSDDRRFDMPSVEKMIIEDVLDASYSVIQNATKSNEDYKKYIENLSKKDFLPGFDDSFIQLYLQKHRADLNEFINTKKADVDINKNIQEDLLIMSALFICKSDYISQKYDNGKIMIVGYGNEEIFPSICSYKFAAKIDGKLICKKLAYINVDINEEGESKPHIYAPSKNNILNTFISGINPELENKMFSLFNDTLNDVFTDVNKVNNISDNEINKIKTRATNSLSTQFYNSKYDICIAPFLKILNIINKEDMKFLVESLINLAIIWGKFTGTEENVGGLTYAALITKKDGFIWLEKNTR